MKSTASVKVSTRRHERFFGDVRYWVPERRRVELHIGGGLRLGENATGALAGGEEFQN